MIYIFLASLSLSLIGLCIKSTHGLVSPAYTMWFRSLGHLLLLTPMLFKNGFKIELRKEALLRSLCGSMGMVLYYVALREMPLAIAGAIFWTAPIFTMLITRLRERKPFTVLDHASLALILMGIGLLCVSRDSGLASISVGTLLLAILSSLAIGASYSYLGLLAKGKESVFSIAYSFSYLTFVFFTPVAIFQAPKEFSSTLLIGLVGVAALSSAYQHTIAKAYTKLSTEESARLQTIIIPIVGVVFDHVFYHHSLNLLSLTGIVFLMMAQMVRMANPRMVMRVASAAIVLFFGLILMPFYSHAFTKDELTARDLHGTWRLVGYSLIQDGVEVPWCKGFFGTLSYFGNRMSVSINCLKRSSNGSVTGKKTDMVFYSGTYEVKPPNAIVHHVENSSDPQRIGHDHIRYATFERPGRVVLLGAGVKGEIKVTWEKTAQSTLGEHDSMDP